MFRIFLLTLISLIVLFSVNRSTTSIPSVPLPTLPLITSTPSPSPSPTVTPPLSFSQLNSLYGPCVNLPVLMYHHVQSESQARQRNQISLSVYTPQFRSHLEYLKARDYHPVSAATVLAYFQQGTPLPSRPILITFDDGYQDFYTDALPVLREFQFPSILFIPTGLLDNPGYLSWSDLANISSSGLVYFGNHSWSHANLASPDLSRSQQEIVTASDQLASRGFPPTLIIAYPFGSFSSPLVEYLSRTGYQLGFTTRPGSILCRQLHLQLPRLRPGNFPLSQLGI